MSLYTQYVAQHSKEEADNYAKHFSDSITTIKVEWED